MQQIATYDARTGNKNGNHNRQMNTKGIFRQALKIGLLLQLFLPT